MNTPIADINKMVTEFINVKCKTFVQVQDTPGWSNFETVKDAIGHFEFSVTTMNNGIENLDFKCFIAGLAEVVYASYILANVCGVDLNPVVGGYHTHIMTGKTMNFSEYLEKQTNISRQE